MRNRIGLAIIQLSLTTTLSAILSYITTEINFKSAINGFWIFSIPAIISILLNDEKKFQILYLFILTFLSFSTAAITSVMSGFY
jgi:hypothetical protein